MESGYAAGRVIARLVMVVGWLAVAGGIALAVMAVLAYNQNFGFANTMNFASAAGLVVSGFLLVLGGQIALAAMDSADRLRQMLEIIRGDEDREAQARRS